jgi:hypothetical protein
LYEQNEEVKIWLKCFMALPLVKDTVVGAVIDYLIDNPPSSHILLIEFNRYFRNQWIDRIPIKYWNLGPIHLRCNNSVEGNVYFVDVIKNKKIYYLQVTMIIYFFINI